MVVSIDPIRGKETKMAPTAEVTVPDDDDAGHLKGSVLKPRSVNSPRKLGVETLMQSVKRVK